MAKAQDRPKPEMRGVNPALGQIVLVLQGGGALGAYQVGVYQALHEAGIDPDWVIGTSIGAINAAIIAGNAPAVRMERLEAFWSRVSHGPAQQAVSLLPIFGAQIATWFTMAGGIAGFFKPNPTAFVSPQMQLGAEAAGYYSTTPLEATLTGLVDFERINRHATRLTVGAANVRTSEMRYFDSRDMPLNVRHIMASGALPPAFPAVRIDNELYWDGGILSNTPVEAVFDDYPRRSGLVFAVHMWNPHGIEPETIVQVQNRQKDLQYSSRAATHIARQKQLHRLRHVIAELGRLLPEADRQREDVQELTGYGCLTRMHVVRLLAPPVEGEDHTRDIDFSPSGIRQRRMAGYEDTRRTLAAAPWEGEFDPLEGFVLHEAERNTAISSS
jgi:NTE family protein